MTLNFEEFYRKAIDLHLREQKRKNSELLKFVLFTSKDGIRKMSPIISYDSSPMDHAQDAIDKLQPDWYCICAEAWASYQPNHEEFVKDYEYGKIQAQSNKYETMIFVAKTMDGAKEHKEWYKIYRNTKGEIERYEKQQINSFETTKLT